MWICCRRTTVAAAAAAAAPLVPLHPPAPQQPLALNHSLKRSHKQVNLKQNPNRSSQRSVHRCLSICYN